MSGSIVGNNILRFEYADARMPVAMTKGGTTYYLAYDQSGTLKAVADGSGVAVKKIEYDSFGNVISDSNPAFAVPFGFAGGLYDRDTKLVRFGYRDYDPETGRWTAKDPILFAGGDTDLYGYCVNDPVNFIDPVGWLTIYGAVGTSVYAGAGGAKNIPGINTVVSTGFNFYTESQEPVYISYGYETDPEATCGAGAGYGPIVGFLTGSIEDFKGKAKNLTIDISKIAFTFTITDNGKWGFSAAWGGRGIGFGYYMYETNTVSLGSIEEPCPNKCK